MLQRIVDLTNKYAEENNLFHSDIILCYHLMEKYNKEHGTLENPTVHNYEYHNGVLIINGEPMERITPLPYIKGARAFSEESYYWEGKCLAKTELD